VTPPFDGPADRGSYLGSLDPQLEERKLASLVGKFRDCFGRLPEVFRAGRYGLSQATTRLLETHGFLVDTSLAPRTDFRAWSAGAGGSRPRCTKRRRRRPAAGTCLRC
jgi:hypothetical protein